MSAHLSPEELRKVSPEEYSRLYGKTDKKPPDDTAQKNAEAARIRAEARLLNARRKLAEEERKANAKPREPRASAAFWVALVISVAQFIFAWYIITHY